MKEIISVNMSKILSVKDANVNILLNVILLAFNQVKCVQKCKMNFWDLPTDCAFSIQERGEFLNANIAFHLINYNSRSFS
jgi:hypothetical protein